MTKRSIYIYGLKCPNENVIRYVGKSVRPKKRYSEHISSAKRKSKSNPHLYNWINKLLVDNLMPELVILEECSKENWKDKEKEWISKFGLDKLTNILEGGEEPPNSTGRKWSKEYKKLFSDQKKGKPQWAHTPHPMLGKFGADNPNYGKKRSKEFCQRMKKRALENNGMKGSGKKVALIDENSNVLKTFNSIKEATTELGLSSGAVSRVCNGEYSHTKGYRFKYI